MKRGLTILLLAVCILLACLWLLHIPARPVEMLRAIPEGAAFVSVHRRPAERLDELTGNPLAKSVLTAAGLDPMLLEDIDEPGRSLLLQIAGHTTAFFYMPPAGNNTGTWGAVCWLGTRSRWWSWWMNWRPGLFPVENVRHGHNIYALPTDSDTGERVRLALVDGAILLTWGRQTGLLEMMLDYREGLFPMSLAASEISFLMDENREDDMVWGRVTDSHQTWYGRLSNVTPRTLGGHAFIEPNPLPTAASGTKLRQSAASALLGNNPLAVLTCDGEYAQKLVSLLPWPAAGATMREILALTRPEQVEVAVLGGDFSGRFHGIRLPSLLVLLSTGNGDFTEENLEALLDRLNRRYRWGLIPRRETAAGLPLTIIEATGYNALAQLSADESPAYSRYKGMLVFASHAAPLRRLLQQREQTAESGGRPPWATAGRREPLYAWVDLAGGNDPARMALAAWSLKLMFDDPGGTGRLRGQLRQAQGWIEALAPLGQAHLRIFPESGILRAEFDVRPPGYPGNPSKEKP